MPCCEALDETNSTGMHAGLQVYILIRGRAVHPLLHGARLPEGQRATQFHFRGAGVRGPLCDPLGGLWWCALPTVLITLGQTPYK